MPAITLQAKKNILQKIYHHWNSDKYNWFAAAKSKGKETAFSVPQCKGVTMGRVPNGLKPFFSFFTFLLPPLSVFTTEQPPVASVLEAIKEQYGCSEETEGEHFKSASKSQQTNILNCHCRKLFLHRWYV